MKFLLLFVLLAAVSYSGFCQTYAILADRLIDGKSDHALPNPTVIVRQGKIIDVNFNKTIPDSAIVINLKGHTLLPGLMDVHTHISPTAAITRRTCTIIPPPIGRSGPLPTSGPRLITGSRRSGMSVPKAQDSPM